MTEGERPVVPEGGAPAGSRAGCCETWPKPCPYHEGWADAVDAYSARQQAADTLRSDELRRLAEQIDDEIGLDDVASRLRELAGEMDRT